MRKIKESARHAHHLKQQQRKQRRLMMIGVVEVYTNIQIHAHANGSHHCICHLQENIFGLPCAKRMIFSNYLRLISLWMILMPCNSSLTRMFFNWQEMSANTSFGEQVSFFNKKIIYNIQFLLRQKQYH